MTGDDVAGDRPGHAARVAVERAFRDDWGQVVATLIARTGDWDLAEECAQDAFAAALRTWPRDGVPDRPGAWLTTTARNRAVDRLRRDAAGAEKLRRLAATPPEEAPTDAPEPDAVPDDRLRLMFTCCHPALPPEARTALTLRTLAGLTTAEIARAFLVTEAAMAKRLTRAKRRIREARIPYRVPPPHLLDERLGGVLAVLYLLFSEGYAATAGPDLTRPDLAGEAIRLTRVLTALMPGEDETRALLALMLLQHSRRDARTDTAGNLVLLTDQDRSRWDARAIAEGTAILRGLRGAPGPYALQAAVAAEHATARTAAATDWARIADLYRRLADLTPTPVVELNRAVAVGMAYGPAAGLARIETLDRDGRLAAYHPLHTAHGEFLHRLGRHRDAAEAYHRAADLAGNAAERRHLAAKADECAAEAKER